MTLVFLVLFLLILGEMYLADMVLLYTWRLFQILVFSAISVLIVSRRGSNPLHRFGLVVFLGCLLIVLGYP